MTVQVAVLNRHGVAMSTDSAVTIPGLNGQDRVRNDGKKLFQAGEEIGFMNYNAMTYCDVTIELILSMFMKRNKGKTAAELSNFSEEFFKFLKSFKIPQNQETYSTLHPLVYDLAEYVEKESMDLEYEFKNLLKEVKLENLIFKDSEKKISTENRKLLKLVLEGRFESFRKNPNSKVLEIFCDLYQEALSRTWKSSCFSGIVFLGYGENQILPCLEHWILDGNCNGRIRHWQVESVDLSEEKSRSAYIFSFGQGDISDLILTGVDRDVLRSSNALSDIKNITKLFWENGINKIYGHQPQSLKDKRAVEDLALRYQKFLSDLLFYLINHSFYENRDSFFERISMLQHAELAEVASTLVKITSVRRMLDDDLRTVGGPINVGVITKSGGFMHLDGDQHLKSEFCPNFRN